MLRKIRKITWKFAVFMLVFSVIGLNTAGYSRCGNMSASNDCCHVQNTVKSCCVKNIKISFEERLNSHCGCTMKEVQQKPDLYVELSNNNSRTFNTLHPDDISLSFLTSVNSAANYYSPPPKSGGSTYLKINNLRI